MSLPPDDDDPNPPSPAESVEATMDRLADGDDAALGRLFDAVAPPLRAYLGKRLEAERVETVIRSVLLEVHRGRSTYIKGADVLVWTFAFARRFAGLDANTPAALEDEILDLVMRGFHTDHVAAILDLPSAQVLSVLEHGRARIEESLTTVSEASRSMSRGEIDLVGTEVGGYRIEELIGSGSFGKVYRATHVDLRQQHAIKVMRELPDDDDGVDRFLGEARMMQGIRHDNIAEVHNAGRLRDGRGWYSMELLRGGTLEEVLADGRSGGRSGRMAWSRVARLVRQLCNGLAQVHARHIVHRDIKPANCFVVGDNPRTETIKLLDFGVATLAQQHSSGPGQAPACAIEGTTAYLAPEVVQGRPADARADIYAIGVMMFEMLTGAAPFAGDSSTAMYIAKLEHRLPSLADAAPGMTFPRGVERVVRRALARDPAQRFQSVEALGAAIDALGPSGRGRLPLSSLGHDGRVRTVATASLSGLLASVVTAYLFTNPAAERSPTVEPALTPTHIETTLANARRRFGECGDAASPMPERASLLVLGETGQVIDAKVLDAAVAPDAAQCVRDILFDLRFPRFSAPEQERIECDL